MPGNCVGQGREFIAPEAGGDEDDPRMRFLPVHEIADDLDEVCDIARDETSSLVRREAELLEVGAPCAPSVMGAQGIESALAQEV